MRKETVIQIPAGSYVSVVVIPGCVDVQLVHGKLLSAACKIYVSGDLNLILGYFLRLLPEATGDFPGGGTLIASVSTSIVRLCGQR